MNKVSKTVVVTGGSRGIGKAISLFFASKGFAVYFNYLNSEKSAKEIEKKSDGKIKAFKADIAKESEIKLFFEKVIEKEGTIDVLVNNAGITKDALLLMMSKEKWNDVINTNLNSVFHCSKLVAKIMLKKKYGRIINISSISGVAGNAGQSNYSASKSGIIGFTKSIAKELASRNITVNAIVPGFIETDMTKGLSLKQKEQIINEIPLKRMGTGNDVAELVFFLAGDSASYITGEVIHINGGLYM